MDKVLKDTDVHFFSSKKSASDIKGKIFVGATQLAVVLIIVILFIILGIIVYEGRSKFSWEFISSFPTNGMTEGGIFPALIGTFILVIIMSIAAVPFGTITALYLTEYASENSKFAAAVRFSVRTLAVVPSIIFGLFGLGFFIQFLGAGADTAFNGGELRWGQPNILWASLTMSLLTLPVIIVSVEEALKTILESSFDILVTDLTMPIINGDQLAIETHQHYGSKIKIFGLTAHTDGAHRLLNPNNVFDFVLIKPASIRDWQQELALEKTYLMTFKDPADSQQSMMKIIASEILIYQEKSLDLLLQCLGKQQWIVSEIELKSMAHKLLGGAKLSNDRRLVKLCEQFQAKMPQPHRPLFYDLCIALTRSNKLLKKIASVP